MAQISILDHSTYNQKSSLQTSVHQSLKPGFRSEYFEEAVMYSFAGVQSVQVDKI